jgi:phosphatidate cytidylyltransferase
MLLHRVLTAVVGIPVALLLIYLGGWYLAAAVALIAVGGLRELYRLLAARDGRALPWLGYPLAIVLTGVAATSSRGAMVVPLAAEAALLVSAFAIAAWWMLSLVSRPTGADLFATISAHIYVPQLLSYLVRLRSIPAPSVAPRGAETALPSGALFVVLLMVVIWGMDTAAYGVGKRWGRRKLCPAISPGKTVAGAIAAFVAAVVLSAAMGYWFRLPLLHGIMLGAAIGILGQGGDLFESMLKRRAGVKDSGALLPGHGGVLDRFDSLLFAAPLAFFYLSFVGM